VLLLQLSPVLLLRLLMLVSVGTMLMTRMHFFLTALGRYVEGCSQVLPFLCTLAAKAASAHLGARGCDD
jgi:hypothetical protein